MSNGGIKIPVSAQFDTSQVEQAKKKIINDLNAMAQALNKAGKSKFEPISPKSVDEVRKLKAEMDALLKIDGDLRRRMQATGQGHLSPLEADYFKMYSNRSAALRKMQAVYQYVAPGAPAGPGGGHGLGQTAGHVAQHAMHMINPLTGGAGNVASGAIRTGMSAGAGAGLMGLLGGFIGFGIHKVIEGVAEQIGGAEREVIAFDRLKRSLGDVNVAFDALKYTVTGAANNVKITFEEAERLGSQFAKLGNLTSGGFVSLRSEIETGVGLSRAFGLDPSSGMGFLGQMRGMGATRDENGSKRMALLVGETIAKSDAFSKADEVMEALANYTTQQTRQSLGAANTAGFAGMFSAMVGAKIPGLDPAGAGALLSRVNSTLAAGGGMGEASQFFTSKLGARRGMDVFDTQLWREGGAFSTADGTFGGDGAVAQFYRKHGLKAPTGSESLLGATMAQIKSEYGSNPKMMLKAMANQMGISMSQAAALGVISPNQMGEMEKYADLTKLSASGIGNMGKALYGSAAERASLRDSLLGRDDLKKEDREALENMTGKSVEEQKKILAGITAQYDQERTTGSDIRDSKNLLDNIKNTLASQLLPVMNDMRAGIIFMAGKGEMTGEEIMTKVLDKEKERKLGQINNQYDPYIIDAEKKLARLKGQRSSELNKAMPRFGEAGEAAKAERDARVKEIDAQIEAAQGERDRYMNEKRSKIKAEEQRVKTMKGAYSGASGLGIPDSVIKSFYDDAAAVGVSTEVAQLGLSIYAQESGGGRNTSTTNHGATGHMQMTPETFKAYADPGWDINNPSHNRMAALRYIADLYKKSKGNLRTTAGAYYGGEKAIGKDGSLKTYRDLKNPRAPDTQEYADQVIDRLPGTPLPVDHQASRGGDAPQRVIFDNLDINVNVNGGQLSSHSKRLTGRVNNGGRAVPFGGAYA